MKPYKILLATAALAVASATGVQAATLSISGGTTPVAIPSDFGPLRDAAGAVATPGDLSAPLTTFSSADSAGDGLLAVDGDGDGKVLVTLTYLGFEAGNKENAGGEVGAGAGSIFRSTTSLLGDSHSFVAAASAVGTAIDLFFRTTGDLSTGCDGIINGVFNPAHGTGCKLAFSDLFGGDTMTYAMFGDGAGDSDLDDLVFKVSVRDLSKIPLPAGGFLLLAGLGSLVALKRRKKA